MSTKDREHDPPEPREEPEASTATADASATGEETAEAADAATASPRPDVVIPREPAPLGEREPSTVVARAADARHEVSASLPVATALAVDTGAGQPEPPAAPETEDLLYWEIVWDQFRKRKIAYGAMWALIVLFLLAVYAPLIASNKPFVWRAEGGSLEFPWFASLFDRNFYESAVDIFFNSLMVPGTFLAIYVLVVYRRTKRLRRRPRVHRRKRALAIAGGGWLASLLLLTVFSFQQPKTVYPEVQAQLEKEGKSVTAVYPPLRYSFRDGNLRETRLGISGDHWLGTDNAGRDVFTRLLYGTRISLTVGIFAVMLYITLGTALGAIAGYYGRWVDAVILRLIEVVLCIPSLFLILTVAAFIEKRSIFHIMVIIAAVRWTTPARLVRAEFLRLRNLDFVKAAVASGFRTHTIIFREILPNAIGPVLVSATFGVAAAILIESTMSFLGLGDITVPSWGQILNTGRTTGSWTLILAPGFAIFFTVSVLNLVGEGVRDALDPKLRS